MKALLKKWEGIVADYEANVTRIWMRPEFHMLFDVTMHSVLTFPFQGREVTRGWVETLIVGDTRTGKSEVMHRLCRHFGMSKPIDCERASMAGIVGGVDKVGDRHTIAWGAIPKHDRRGLVLDEFAGLQPEEISSLSSIRSSGVAEITKIHAERAMARVRKLCIANPRVDFSKKMNQYLHGIQAVPGVVGRAEDIARFDMAFCAGASDVPIAVLNRRDVPKVKHVYDSKACQTLLYWAWTRRPGQVVWEEGAENAVLDLADRHCRDYHSGIPLVEQGEQRMRVARVAVALAARFFSTDKTLQNVVVGKRHVELADWFFERLYAHPACGYKQWSGQQKRKDAGPTAAEIEMLEHKASGSTWLMPTLEHLAGGGDIDSCRVIPWQDRASIVGALNRAKLIDTFGQPTQHLKEYLQSKEAKP